MNKLPPEQIAARTICRRLNNVKDSAAAVAQSYNTVHEPSDNAITAIGPHKVLKSAILGRKQKQKLSKPIRNLVYLGILRSTHGISLRHVKILEVSGLCSSKSQFQTSKASTLTLQLMYTTASSKNSVLSWYCTDHNSSQQGFQN